MPTTTEKDLPDDGRTLWLKALSAIELRNYGYAISLLQSVLKQAPGFLDARKMLRKAEVAATKGKKNVFGSLSTISLKGGQAVKKDPMAAMELAEKTLETDPYNTQANHLLKDAARAATMPEIAAFALETLTEGYPKDTKVLHELAQQYYEMGENERAVNTYNRIVEINPADLIALKKGKDAAARQTMKSGGWETAKDYRDLIKDKDVAVSLEQKSRVVRSLEMTDEQIGEVSQEWENNKESVDLSRRLAKLWEERYEYKQDQESLHGAVYFYTHVNELAGSSDPGIVRKLSDLQFRQLDLGITALEQWFAEGGDQHPEADKYREELAALKQHRAEMLISEARKRVERNPTDLQMRFELGEQLLVAGQHGDAIPELQKARQNPNVRLRAMGLLGQCFEAKNMLDMAKKTYEDASGEILAMDEVKKDLVYRLGIVFEKMGDKKQSIECFKKIYEVDYGYKDVARRVEESYGG